ncbi:GNAT family N-acetyltransferase [Paenibacillus antri]|uniref:GNAT family N-acetyltransferase n=1 Tax=Paenibacillus antri TaxID=2582848 RepID=A0A5R9GFZ8_9BACL|nr:GNAT family N-acetyltransferase [Paenibacillus antri]TLS52214.1 GNAT family N-acetyltransferase [Paenibacillus antri]
MEIVKTLDHEIIARLNKDVHDIHVLLYPEYFKKYEYESISGFFKKIVNNPNYDFLVIKGELEYFGYAWIEEKEIAESVFMKAHKFIFVHQLSTQNDYRHQGLGSQLMNKIEDIARERGIQKIQLDYWSNNVMAREFYEKKGYSVYREFIYKNLE